MTEAITALDWNALRKRLLFLLPAAALARLKERLDDLKIDVKKKQSKPAKPSPNSYYTSLKLL